MKHLRKNRKKRTCEESKVSKWKGRSVDCRGIKVHELSHTHRVWQTTEPEFVNVVFLAHKSIPPCSLCSLADLYV
jgi:hypothetical protein